MNDYSSFTGGQVAVATKEDDSLVATFRRMLLEEVDLHELSKIDANQRRARLERVIAHLVSREGVILSASERNQLVRRVVDEAVGLGVLEPILNDPGVSEIMINGHDTIFVERSGKLERWPALFSSEEQLLQTIDRIVSTVNRRVDESSPMVDARLPADSRMPRGARVNVVLPPLSLNGPTVTIRLFPMALSLSQLMERDSIDRRSALLLKACVEARLNVVVSGGTGSGKTTLLNALSSFISPSERIVTIEDAAELSLDQPHTIRLETRPANVEGRGQVSIRDLVRNSLRMRPDRIIVGECRGGEALDMLQAMNTGHEGSLTTVHANTPDDALSRLETLASMSDVEVPFHALRDQVNSAIDVIVQLNRLADGSRRVVDVSWVSSRRQEDFDLVPLMRYVIDRSDPTKPVGQFEVFDLPERFRHRLLAGGADLSQLEVT
ncbi:CpaF family protein [Knoellia subterranea]|uniref:Secretion protein n=1 Tax=Knoellia subterranea KCTC 19937 TaxID=1385521 RepID=A0A0A0JLH8_9MICO|nr:CpaF family protein [Knoellia subterranea]KGN38310.1 secretion protein [Knoellia subterranea KCTC 19937]